MDRVARDVGRYAQLEDGPRQRRHNPSIAEAVAEAACRAAVTVDARAIAVMTQSGSTAALISKFRPPLPIIAFTQSRGPRRRLSLYWGVVPRVMEPIKNTDAVADLVSERLLEDGLCQPGDRIVLVHGSPVGIAGQTNSIRLHEIPRPSDLAARKYRVPV